MHKLIMLFLSLSFFGCSNKAVYDNMQLNNRRACDKVPPSQYEECIDRASKTYEEYERERNEEMGK